MLATWMALIWSRTFIGMANGCGTTAFEILGSCVLTVVCTFMWGCSLFAWDDETGFFYKEYETDISVPVLGEKDSNETDSEEADPEETEGAEDAGVSEETEGMEDVEGTEDSGVSEEQADLDDEEECDAVESNFLKMLKKESWCREPVLSSGLRNSLCVVLTLTVICLLSFALAGWAEWLDFFSDSTYMQIGWFCINKKYIYDVLVVVVFPVWTTFIIRKVKESEFTSGAVFSGIMQILALTMIGFLLYMGRSNIWLIEMAVLNVITLILDVRGYAWRNIRKKGNAVALLILYVMLWIALISIFYHSGQSFAGFMGFTDMTHATSYITNVHKIAENASFVGQSSTLLNDPYVISFIKDSHYLLPSVLFYCGWLPVILLMLVEIIFIVAAAGVLAQTKEHDGRDVMLDVIWVGFLIRVIVGILYSFGLPLNIALPFSGTVSIVTDSICMGVLLMGYINRKWNAWCELYADDDSEHWEDDEYEEDDE